MTTDPLPGDIVATAERQTAARCLLAEPLLTESVWPEEFALVRSHADWLSQRFEALLGYRLTVDAHFARLVKHTVPAAAARPRAGAETGARTYVYLTLILAVLPDLPDEVEVGALTRAVRAAGQEAGLHLSAMDRAGERHPLAAALRRLQSWGLLSPVGGSSMEAPLTEGGVADRTILRVHSDLLAHSIARLPHTESDSAEFLAGAPGRSAETQEQDIALDVRRRIVEEAAVYRDSLTERQARWLAGNQSRCLAELSRFLGCEAEIRAEGVALVAPAETYDCVFPVGAEDRAAVGVLAALVAQCAPTQPGSGVAVDESALRGALSALPDPLAGRRVLDRLAKFSLLSRNTDNGEWHMGAASARYRFPVGATQR